MAAVRDGPTLGTQAERLATGGERSRSLLQAHPAAGIVARYALAGAGAWAIAIALGRDPLTCDGWLGVRGPGAWLTSLGLGLPLGAATIAVTRVAVRRAAWARALHVALRPAVRGAGNVTLFAVAAASATGEELLFRGLLVPLIGVLWASLVFGLMHQIRGPARWGWMAWATVMGLLFAGIFVITGSLAGPLVAHAAINHANLRFLRDNDPSPRPRVLGGLLGGRDA